MNAKFKLAAAAMLLLCGAAAQAQETQAAEVKVTPGTAAAVCPRMSKPEIPPADWKGSAVYQVLATVKAGRVVSVQMQNMLGGQPRKLDRSLKNAILQSMQDSYDCPGDHLIEQTFTFKFGG